jgi:hypothetical protein
MGDFKKIVKDIIYRKYSSAVDFITKDRDKIDKLEQKKINKEINNAGMDGNGRFEKIDHALSKLSEILSNNNLEFDEVMSSDRFRNDSGRLTFELARKTKDPHQPINIKNRKMVFTWHVLSKEKVTDTYEKKKYEILSYVT